MPESQSMKEFMDNNPMMNTAGTNRHNLNPSTGTCSINNKSYSKYVQYNHIYCTGVLRERGNGFAV
jgi:hypothetical protein